MTQIVDVMLDGKRYKVFFPDDAPPRAYAVNRNGHAVTLLGRGSRGRPELHDRVVEAATLAAGGRRA